MSTRTWSAIGLSALLACAVVSRADVKTFTGNVDTNFHVSGNWSPAGMPDDGDRIVIPAGEICDVVEGDNEQVVFPIDTMEVQWTEQDGDGILNIDDGITLILENDDDNVSFGEGPELPDHCLINGLVNLGAGDVGGGTLVVRMQWGTPYFEHLFMGDGAIDGLSERNVIEIQEDRIFVNLLGGAGDDNGMFNHFTMEAESGTATFSNEGRLVGDGGVVTFESSVILDDVEGAIWGLDDCNSAMIFHQDADLDGDFVMFGDDDEEDPDGGGMFRFAEDDITVTTSGFLVIENAACPYFRKWEFASGASFVYEYFDCAVSPGTCSSCGNPCDNNPCTSPYVVDTSKQLGTCIIP